MLAYEQMKGGSQSFETPSSRTNFDVKGFVVKYSLKLTSGNFVQAEWDESVGV